MVDWQLSKKEQLRKWRLENKDKIRRYKRRWYLKNKEKSHNWTIKYYHENKEKILAQHKQYLEKKRQSPIFRENEKMRNRERDRKIQIEVFQHYSNGEIKCRGCGFNDIRALSLDHIKACGQKYRKWTGAGFYKNLRKNNYPKGYQVLCMNCQFIKRHEKGECKKVV